MDPTNPERKHPEISEASHDGRESNIPNLKLQDLEKQVAADRLLHNRMGDRFLEAGLLEKALDRYIQSGDQERLKGIKKTFIAKGLFAQAEIAAQSVGGKLEPDEYMQLAIQCFDKGDLGQGYQALEKAGIKLLGVENMPDYFMLSGSNLKAELLMHLGNMHLKRSEWYEARRRYEDARMISSHRKNEASFNLSLMRLKKLGDTCLEKGALFDAFMCYKEAKSINQLKELCKICLRQLRPLESLANWIEEEIIVIEEENLSVKKEDKSLVGTAAQ